ncbi:MAG: hypothetical protein LR015_01290 [Verrucomicrobia bacterium]|nr:hypothetical protein [Verrucomicrobiota bacterium]
MDSTTKQPFSFDLKHFAVVFAVAFAVLCLVYLPTLLFTFGHSDDYIFFSFFRSGLWHPLVNEITAMGRPLNSLLLWLFLGHGNDLSTLTILRAFGLATQALFAATIYCYLRHSNYTAAASASVTALWVFTPAMAVYAGWAIVTHYALGLTMAFIAGALFLEVATAKQSQWFSAKSWLTAILMVSAIALYQPTFYAACIPLLLWYVREYLGSSGKNPTAVWILFLKFFIYTSIILVLYLVAFKTFSLFVDYEDPAVQRTRLNIFRVFRTAQGLVWITAADIQKLDGILFSNRSDITNLC